MLCTTMMLRLSFAKTLSGSQAVDLAALGPDECKTKCRRGGKYPSTTALAPSAPQSSRARRNSACGRPRYRVPFAVRSVYFARICGDVNTRAGESHRRASLEVVWSSRTTSLVRRRRKESVEVGTESINVDDAFTKRVAPARCPARVPDHVRAGYSMTTARADEGYHGLRLACEIRQRGFLKVVSIAGQREEGAALARYPLPFSGEGVESIRGVAYTDRFAIHPCAALSRSESSVPAIRYSFLSCANLSSVNRG